ncbi:hypothetical protein SHDE107825_01220 [Shewanella denitrificans]|jgi:hypothetical protein
MNWLLSNIAEVHRPKSFYVASFIHKKEKFMSKSNVCGKDFFASLYEQEQVMPSAEYDRVVSRLAVKAGSNTMFGDQALQSLLVNFVTENATTLEEVKNLRAALAGIKQMAISSIAKSFPKANIEELICAATAAGYDVKVL